jgi:2-polyprenyl-3-methyl-5-hydroxy-6-metoxy-1,4-benzoquinol methylase
MQSKITGGTTSFLFKELILGKYEVGYYKCNDTGFIQTDEVFWLEEAYASAITNLDLGLVNRNIELSKKVLAILLKYFYDGKQFLDYGGGYGMYVRMMRDQGFNFYLYDTYCENIFAKNYAFSNLDKQWFTAVTAFEVMEHLVDPIVEFTKLFNHTDTIIFSTEIVPNQNFTSAKDWWYFSPITGQHIALFTVKSLEYIATKFGATLYTNGTNLHIITKQPLPSNPFVHLKKLDRLETFFNSIKKRWSKLRGTPFKKESLLGKDIKDAMMK